MTTSAPSSRLGPKEVFRNPYMILRHDIGRRLLILTRTMERRHQLGLDSYDRFFPNQDTMPKGGFGNLIALPLQKQPREQGHSLFVDDALQAFPDQ